MYISSATARVMASWVDSLQQSFRLADAADILIVAVFLYTFCLWFKSTASRQILIGIGLLGVVYAAARAFDLYMTSAIFQACLAVAAIALIVVFQEDLRRTFARLASLWSLPRAGSQIDESDLDTLVEIAFELADKKIGALLAIQGTESLERHVRGGVAVDARIRKALLDSIFDPHSLGHDGAVIIDRDRISEFGVRLPLSENSKELGSRGTRHCAGLGLSELTDSLIVIVSEERGHVSVAERGKIHRVETAVELKKQLDEFTQRTSPSRSTELRKSLISQNLGLKIIALLVASLAWLLTGYETETVQKTFVVPIEYRNLPEAMDLHDDAPIEARVTLTGFERAFNLLAPSALTISLDLADIKEGRHQIAIDESFINLPSNLTLFRSSPRILTLGVETWTASRLPVEYRNVGRLPRELREREIVVVPKQVHVQIWRSRKATVTSLYTEPFDVGRLAESSSLKVKLDLPKYMRLETGRATDVEVILEKPGNQEKSTPTP
ncbi:MAG: diadenylate cyclase [Planctomycetota bacterium]|jgi:uncharacterized protein (TIGR00159 family)